MNKWVLGIILVILTALLAGGLHVVQAATDAGEQVSAALNGEQTGVVSVIHAPLPFQVLVGLIVGFCLLLAVMPLFMDEPGGMVE